MSKRIMLDIRSKNVVVDGRAVQVLGKISCLIEAGSFVSVIGPSGCGKSTLLRAIMGLDTDFAGQIHIGDQLVQRPGVDRGIVFQEPRLLPWASVRENIAFAIPTGAQSIYTAGQVERLMDLFGLRDFANAWPNQLSGGMMQRVALARALVNLPEVLLMDEPFGALDAHTKTLMQEELLGIFQSQLTTTAMVTHDVEEAVYLSDAVLVLSGRPGSLVELVQVGLSKPRDRSDPAFLALRFDILRRAFGGEPRLPAATQREPRTPEDASKHLRILKRT